MPGKGVLWRLIATAEPSGFSCREAVSGGREDKAGGTKGRASEETGKDGWLAPEQGCDQYRLRRDPKKGRRTKIGPRLQHQAPQGQPAQHITLNPGAIACHGRQGESLALVPCSVLFLQPNISGPGASKRRVLQLRSLMEALPQGRCEVRFIKQVKWGCE